METTIEEAATMSPATAEKVVKKLVQATIDLHPPLGMEEKWQLAPNLSTRAKAIIDKHNMTARHFKIAYFWRKTGGMSRGKPRFGDVKLLTGMERELTGLDAEIWMAADHCQPIEDIEIEAQLFHLLSHISSNDETGAAMLLAHDFEGFTEELSVYGAYSMPLAKAKAVFEQAKLPLLAAKH